MKSLKLTLMCAFALFGLLSSGCSGCDEAVVGDQDDDGIPDYADVDFGNNGRLPDTDGDGIIDEWDADVDGDGVIDNGPDADGDGVKDRTDDEECVGDDCEEEGVPREDDNVLSDRYQVPGGVVGVPEALLEQYPNEIEAEAHDGDGYCLGFELEQGYYYYYPCDDGRPAGSGPHADDPRFNQDNPGNDPTTGGNPNIIPVGSDPGLGIEPGTCWERGDCFTGGRDPIDNGGRDPDPFDYGEDPPGEGDYYGADPEPSGEACRTEEFAAQSGPTEVVVILDRSNSMAAPFEADNADKPAHCRDGDQNMDETGVDCGGSCAACKWDVMTSALENALSTQTELSFGMATFPSHTVTGAGCTGANISQACMEGDVAVAVGPSGAAQVTSLLQTLGPCGGTPMAGTLENAIDAFNTGSASRKVAILATDGGPNCGGRTSGCTLNDCTNPEGSACMDAPFVNCLEDEAAVSAVESLRAVGVETYVLGIEGSGSFANILNEMAVRGGTAKDAVLKYFPVGSESQMLGQIEDVLNRTTSCVLTVDYAIDKTADITVTVNGRALGTNEFYFLGHNQVALHDGELCSSIAEIDYCPE